MIVKFASQRVKQPDLALVKILRARLAQADAKNSTDCAQTKYSESHESMPFILYAETQSRAPRKKSFPLIIFLPAGCTSCKISAPFPVPTAGN